tara:strand:+ start:313 stop:666 length:354 start_codon:yes stop_codon:yes gene_type:complete
MVINSILKYKDWICSFSNSYYSLKHSDVEIVDNIDGHQELLEALTLYISRKKKSKCNYFRITDDIKNVSVVVAKNQTQNFLNYLKEISSEIDKYSKTRNNHLNEFYQEEILKDISAN